MTTQELIEKAKDQRKRDRAAEAVISAQRATELDPESAEAWWQLALSLLETTGPKGAEEALEKTVELAPHFAYGWVRFGKASQETGQHTRAKGCFERAVEEDAEQTDALLALSHIYENEKNDEDEYRTLLALDTLINLNSYGLHRLGNLHYQKKRFDNAIDCYRRAAHGKNDPACLYNIGLVYHHSDVRQNADAVDIWRLTIKRYPTHAITADSLNRALPATVALRDNVLRAEIQLLSTEQRYLNYINPCVLLGLDVLDDPQLLEPKRLQKAKKALLQEIDLEDGHVSALPGLIIDRSRAIAICEELSDAETRTYHHHVLANPPLLNFLCMGSLDHFLVHPEMSPLATVELLEADSNGFGKWLSTRFAPQFALVLAKAIESRNALAVECLLSGRRWTALADNDRCFEAARRQVDGLLTSLREAAHLYETKKPTLKAVEAILLEGSLAHILGLLPNAFHDAQTEAAALLRSISIDCFNVHGDADLAKAVLQLGRAFSSKSAVLAHQLEIDTRALDERINEERKDEAKLKFGERAYEITKEGARFGTEFVAADQMESVRWGILVDRSSSTVMHAYSMVLAGAGKTVKVEWRGQANDKTQHELFNKMIGAVFSYIVPGLVDRIRIRLQRGARIPIGRVIVVSDGVELEVRGWFSTKAVLIPWTRLSTELSNGDLVIRDPQTPKAEARLPLHLTDNAMVLACMSSLARQQ